METTTSPHNLGTQLLADAQDCQAPINDSVWIEKLGLDIAELAQVTVLHQHTHHFSPQGLSSVLVLAESHLAIHTWPEHRFFSLDLFTCGLELPHDQILNFLRERLQSAPLQHQIIARGQL